MKLFVVTFILMFFNLDVLASSKRSFSDMETEIRHVWSGGAWANGEQKGFYRFMVLSSGYQRYKSKLYVQWIWHGSKMEAPKVISSIGVSELNYPAIYSFSVPTCIGGWECATVQVNATHTHELTEHTFFISFSNIGAYRFMDEAL